MVHVSCVLLYVIRHEGDAWGSLHDFLLNKLSFLIFSERLKPEVYRGIVAQHHEGVCWFEVLWYWVLAIYVPRSFDRDAGLVYGVLYPWLFLADFKSVKEESKVKLLCVYENTLVKISFLFLSQFLHNLNRDQRHISVPQQPGHRQPWTTQSTHSDRISASSRCLDVPPHVVSMNNRYKSIVLVNQARQIALKSWALKICFRNVGKRPSILIAQIVERKSIVFLVEVF